MLKHRFAFGLPLGCLALASFLCPGRLGATLFLAFGAFLLLEGLREFHNMAQGMGLPGSRASSYLAGLGFLAVAPLAAWAAPSRPATLTGALDAMVLAVFLSLLALSLLRKAPSRHSLSRCGVSMAGVLYVAWTMCFVAKLYFSGPDGPHLVLYLIVVTKAGDVGAFTIGSLTAKLPGGNHKLCPRLSPKKSWEGLGGGIAGSLACAFLLLLIWPGSLSLHGEPVVTSTTALFLGLLAPVVGFLGDAAESAFKRASGFKDSGNLPGLGGVLDILDSIIPVAPLFYAYIHVLAAS
jgi:phosphatidate cytidylyltransferase